ncbi:SIVA protein, partial [Polyodon spathula]|nr:SIVA protein [Polyodon spathula]
MPKRTYPFSETFSLQHKMHIGQKEVNQGVSGNKYRQEVYEKTKNLLFSGTKAIMGKIWKADDDSRRRPDQSPSPAAALMRGQTLIGQDGTLKRNSAVSNAGIHLFKHVLT